MKKIALLLSFALFFIVNNVNAQCASGEVEVFLIVSTDNFGSEIYWEIVPSGNSCGNGTVDFGGNSAVGCDGGGSNAGSNNPGKPGGYGDGVTATEGPWCLTDGDDFDIISVDEYGDGGAKFEVKVEGYSLYEFKASGDDEVFAFTAEGPPENDASVEKITTSENIVKGDINLNVTISADIKNLGSDTITSLNFSWSIDDGNVVTETVSDLSIAPFTESNLEHSVYWWPKGLGEYSAKVWVSNVNGKGDDDDTSNDSKTKTITIKEGTPDITQSYLDETVTLTYEVIGSSSDQVSTPRDLDFHPNGDLWVINKGTESSGGSTVKFTNPGETDQTSEYKQDGNAWHFMSLPSAIAFSDNGNFGTTTSVYDANHNGGDAFTGPSLWSSDPAVYAQPSGGNGSHLDMLHESPNCMGMAHEKDNVFWVFDDYSNDIVRYDFVDDHGPGNDDHSDAKIRRFPELVVKSIDDNISCHLILDKFTKWLYIVDGGNQRILGLDITSGSPGGTPSYGPYETLAEYTNMSGAIWEVIVSSGLTQPSGIALFGSRLFVSDYSTGDIIIYDKTDVPAKKLGTIKTGNPGIMGIVFGPDGRLWYANATDSKIIKIEPDKEVVNAINEPTNNDRFQIHPNPSTGIIHLNTPSRNLSDNKVTVIDAFGRSVYSSDMKADQEHTIDLSHLPAGYYYVKMVNGDIVSTRKFIKVD
ncbi:T9SS type A sorting domain-containing protein [bacterium AH-315-C07]|nr:T9SS type A sorting domain-containing protein [bacterium AH-315-C07]